MMPQQPVAWGGPQYNRGGCSTVQVRHNANGREPVPVRTQSYSPPACQPASSKEPGREPSVSQSASPAARPPRRPPTHPPGWTRGSWRGWRRCAAPGWGGVRGCGMRDAGVGVGGTGEATVGGRADSQALAKRDMPDSAAHFQARDTAPAAPRGVQRAPPLTPLCRRGLGDDAGVVVRTRAPPALPCSNPPCSRPC